jgi:putative hydrolase of the HAD superfamily
MKLEAITFDAGGTLLYPSPSVGVIYAKVMNAHGLVVDVDLLEATFHDILGDAQSLPQDNISGECYKSWWGEIVGLILTRLEVEPDNFDVFFDDLWRVFADPESWALYPDAKETLITLKEMGYRLVILSNWDGRLRGLLEGLEIDWLFDEIIISSEVGFEKPDERIFQFAEVRLGLGPSQILHVGDSIYHDIEGASEVGWHCKLIQHGSTRDETDVKIGSLMELLSVL